MKTIAEQITAFEAKRAAHVARQTEIQAKAIEDSRSKNDAEREEFDGLTAEVDAIDTELKDLRAMQKQAAVTATVIDKTVGVDPALASKVKGGGVDLKDTDYIRVEQNVEKGVLFARFAMARIRAKGNLNDALSIVQNEKRWKDTTPQLETIMKTAVAAGDTTTSGWASELVYAQNMESEFVDYLRPMTVIGKLPLRRVPFNIRYGVQNGIATGNWIGQGAPIPVSKLSVTSGSLGIAKAAAIVPIDEELARLSTPSAELLVRDDMAKTLATFLDVQFLDPNVAISANISPASITNGVTAVTATGTTAAALRTDLATLMTSWAQSDLDISQGVFIMTPDIALQIALMLNSLGLPLYPDISVTGGKLLGLPVVVSNSANIPGSTNSGRMIILCNPPEILLADDGNVSIDVSREASIQMLDNPTNTSTGGTTATTMVSMFQTASMAIRAIRYMNWVKRRSIAVTYIKEAAYSA